MAKKDDTHLKGIGLLVLGVVGVLAVVSLILLFSQARTSGQATFAAEPYEEGLFAGGNIEWPVATKTVLWECRPGVNTVGGTGKEDGEFQKVQCAFDGRSKDYWESRGFNCQEATKRSQCVVNANPERR